MMEVTDERKSNGILVVRISGRLTADSSDKLKKYLTSAIEKNRMLILDLAGMTYIDSTGLGVLVFALQKGTDGGRKFALVNLQDKPRLVFEITNAFTIFDVFDSFAEAEKYVLGTPVKK